MAAAPHPPRFDREERQILLFTGVAHALTHYAELSYPALAVVIAADSGIPAAEVLSWSLAGYALFGFAAIPVGLIADRFGARRVITGGLLLAGASSLLAAFSSLGFGLALCLAGVGLGASAYHPAGMGLLSKAVRARGNALGINGIYGNAGIALAPLLTASLGVAVGWRVTFGLTGLLLLAGGLLGLILRFEEPPPVPRVSGPAPDAAPATAPGNPSGISRVQLLAFLALCAAAMLGGFSYRANTVAQPVFFEQHIHFASYGVAVFIAMVAGIGGQYLGGRIADRFPLGWSYFAFHLLSLPMLVLVAASTEGTLLLVASAYVFFALGMQPIENSLYAALTPERWRSTAYGLKFTLTFGIGASAVWLVRGVGETEGFGAVYRVLAVVVAVLVASAGVLAVVQGRLPRAIFRG